MNRLSFCFNNILYYLILLLPLVWIKRIMLLGEDMLPLLIIVLEVVLICKRILENKGKKIIIKNYSIDKYIGFFIMVYALWRILSYSLGIFNKEIIDMEFYTMFFAVMLLYLLMDFQVTSSSGWHKAAVVGGSVGSLFIFSSTLKDVEISHFTETLTTTPDGVVSYLVLVNFFSITHWIIKKEENKWNPLWLTVTGFNMFVLLLMQSHIGNWLIVLSLLAVAAFFRPRASLIKKVGILLFLFLFLWSNMSLVLNYTETFSVEAVYSLETAVYMELLLALGGLLFFHFWDRIPEDADLHKISMVKMQHYFRMVLGVVVFVFVLFVLGGNEWKLLDDGGMKGFIKTLALPLSSELIAGSSTMFVWLQKLGLMGVFLLLIWLYQMGIRLYKRCGIDKEMENCFFLFYVIFLVEIFMWELPVNVIIAFVTLLAIGNVKPKMIEKELDDENKENQEI